MRMKIIEDIAKKKSTIVLPKVEKDIELYPLEGSKLLSAEENRAAGKHDGKIMMNLEHIQNFITK